MLTLAVLLLLVLLLCVCLFALFAVTFFGVPILHSRVALKRYEGGESGSISLPMLFYCKIILLSAVDVCQEDDYCRRVIDGFDYCIDCGGIFCVTTTP